MVMAIPAVDVGTGNLPPGDHLASWDEVRAAFGWSPRRRLLLSRLSEVLQDLAARGVQTVWLDGSFVGGKIRPNDIDVIYDPPPGAVPSTWGPLAPQQRGALKTSHHVDLWPHPSPQSGPGPGVLQPLHDFFGRDRDGRAKGLVMIIGLGDIQ